MGLDSLIPNKNGGGGYRDDNDGFSRDDNNQFSNSPNNASRVRSAARELENDEFRDSTPRREREDLGVLSSLLSGNQRKPRDESPFEQSRSSYEPPVRDSYAPRYYETKPQPPRDEFVPPRPAHDRADAVDFSPEFPSPFREEHEHSPLREEWGEPIIETPRVSRQTPVREKIPESSTPVFQVELNKIVENPYQPRKEFDPESLNELAVSIREFGVLQPLVVTRANEETDYGTKVTYQLIAGHRRLLAAKKAGLKTVPVIIRNQLKRADALEMAIVENIQRQDLNVIETARAYARLSDEFGLTQREIAARLGKSRESIANTLRLLSLPTHMQDALSQGKINESHARILLQIQDPARQQQTFDQIVHEGLSVRDVKRTLQRAPVSPHASRVHATPEVKAMEKDISDVVGAPVHIELSEKGGKIVIHFFSPEEAQGIAQRIKREQQY